MAVAKTTAKKSTPKVAGVKVNKLMWTAIVAVLGHIMRSANMSPADISAVHALHLDPVTKVIDSDGDGVPDDKDAEPHNAAVA